jgi:hypothetical protein
MAEMSSTTRHKSCLVCIQTKRKYDRTWPRCQRYVARGSECQYIGRSWRRSQCSSSSSADELILLSEPLGGQPASNWQLQQYHAEPMSLLTCYDGALLKLPNHPFSLWNMPENGNFILDSIQDDVIQQVPSSAIPDTIQTITSGVTLQARVHFVANRLTTKLLLAKELAASIIYTLISIQRY